MSTDFDSRIEALDESLFDAIHSQSSVDDKRAWLAVQRGIRRAGTYSYLEIGSYLGGSIQQHLLDPRCTHIVSIDNRPFNSPDDRGEGISYGANSTELMLDHLERVAPDALRKVTCFETDASDVNVNAIKLRADYCFIDGEHTMAGVLSDFAFCLEVSSPNAAICFHDDAVVYRAIARILVDLREKGVPFTALKIKGQTFGIFLRDCPALQDQHVMTHSQSAASWLFGRRLREWMPSGLRPLAKGLARRLVRGAS